jgi:hypothetical protein
MSMGHFKNYNDMENPKYSEKTCPSATLSITYPTWKEMGPNQGLDRVRNEPYVWHSSLHPDV